MKRELVRLLRAYGQQRQAVARMDEAMQVLSPEERLVADRLLIYPRKGGAQQLCQMLNVEQASIYRRRDKVLEKLARVLEMKVDS